MRMGDFAGNCRGEVSSEGSAFRRVFVLMGAAAKHIGSNEIAYGAHSRARSKQQGTEPWKDGTGCTGFVHR